VVDNAVLRERMQLELDCHRLAADQAEREAQELNVFARILIDAVKEKRRHGKTD
jgi:hypothetical protein